MSELETEILGGLQGDPAVFAFQKTTGEGILFDLGSIEQISSRNLLKVFHVFVSHTHMDHFAGFDRWLRVNIPHRRLLHIWGPAPFFERVQAKLKSYAWNLIADDQLRFEVHEIRSDGAVASALLTNTDNFAIRERGEYAPSSALVSMADGSVVSASELQHINIPSIAYKVQPQVKQRFLQENLSELNLNSGPWIGRLQSLVANGSSDGKFEADGRKFDFTELASKLIRSEAGQSLVYLTDLSFDRKNLAALKRDFGEATKVICEASFLDEDRARAVSKAHLTTRQAALIAMSLDAKILEIFHVSTYYGHGAEKSLAEAEAFFAEFSQLSANDREKALEAEFSEVEKLLAP